MASEEVRLSLEQQHSVEMCVDTSQRIVGVTGGAGTGKTLVLGKAIAELAKGNKYVLCAPTGRAAKRIYELTKIKAKTIHRLLEFPQPDEATDAPPNEPRRNAFNPLEENVVFVDEASMVSPTLYRQLLEALPKGGCVRFFGDNNQLPPVEEGDPPFIDVLENYPSVELTFNFRSEDNIVSNALRILEGRIPVRNAGFEIFYMDDPIVGVTKFAGQEFMRNDHQIIMPTRKGKAGTLRVNPSLQLKFNGKGETLRLDRYDEKEAPLTVRAKDKFIWIKNDYKLDLFNGDIGTIDWIDPEEGDLGLITPEREITVPPRVKTYNSYIGTMINYDPRKQLELGYAITTHKSQGSEFDTVIYCMSRSQAFLLNRRNFYTAITRAKRKVILVTDRRAMGLSMRRAQM